MRTALSLVLAALLPALTACGGGDAADRPATTTSTTPDISAVQSIAIELEDFPSGWRRSESASGTGGVVSKCLRFGSGPAARSASPAFEEGAASLAGSVSVLLADAAAAAAAIDDVDPPTVRRCIARELPALLERQSTSARVMVGEVAAEPIALSPLGERRAGLSVVVPLTIGTQRTVAVVEVVAIQAGRGLAALFTLGSGQPVEASLRGRLATALERRLRGATS